MFCALFAYRGEYREGGFSKAIEKFFSILRNLYLKISRNGVLYMQRSRKVMDHGFQDFLLVFEVMRDKNDPPPFSGGGDL